MRHRRFQGAGDAGPDHEPPFVPAGGRSHERERPPVSRSISRPTDELVAVEKRTRVMSTSATRTLCVPPGHHDRDELFAVRHVCSGLLVEVPTEYGGHCLDELVERVRVAVRGAYRRLGAATPGRDDCLRRRQAHTAQRRYRRYRHTLPVRRRNDRRPRDRGHRTNRSGSNDMRAPRANAGRLAVTIRRSTWTVLRCLRAHSSPSDSFPTQGRPRFVSRNIAV